MILRTELIFVWKKNVFDYLKHVGVPTEQNKKRETKYLNAVLFVGLKAGWRTRQMDPTFRQ